jgi:hypothetical protein
MHARHMPHLSPITPLNYLSVYAMTMHLHGECGAKNKQC